VPCGIVAARNQTANLLALHISNAVLICILWQLSREIVMGESATSGSKALDLDALIETDSKILEQVLKDLSQEYILYMSGLVKERLAIQSGGSASAFDHLDKSPAAPGGLS